MMTSTRTSHISYRHRPTYLRLAMRRPLSIVRCFPFLLLLFVTSILDSESFLPSKGEYYFSPPNRERSTLILRSNGANVEISSVEEATDLLANWDRYYSTDSASNTSSFDASSFLPLLPDAVLLLSTIASRERSLDSTKGRCLLGICASSAEEGIATLKSWVTALELPRGLIHGMDKDGEPVPMDGGVYLKYNTGGSLSFSDIRKSGLGFDALWRPGDVLVESYDGAYRGVYFQVELEDDVFRQFLVPLGIFNE